MRAVDLMSNFRSEKSIVGKLIIQPWADTTHEKLGIKMIFISTA
jgi:hypothetical protein